MHVGPSFPSASYMFVLSVYGCIYSDICSQVLGNAFLLGLFNLTKLVAIASMSMQRQLLRLNSVGLHSRTVSHPSPCVFETLGSEVQNIMQCILMGYVV